MRIGYAFEYKGKNWQRSSDECWDTVVYTPKGDEKLVGGRYIDGYQHRVYLCRDGRYRAQLAL